MSVPSIPSRFLTPVIDAAQHDNEDSQDICKMSRLVDDPTKVGPGTYLVSEDAVKKSPKSTINWQNSRSMRSGVWASNMTQPSVGPGSYTQSNMHYKPMQPFFPRNGATKK